MQEERDGEREMRSAVAFYCLICRRYVRCYFFFAFWPSKFGQHWIVYFSCHACSFFCLLLVFSMKPYILIWFSLPSVHLFYIFFFCCALLSLPSSLSLLLCSLFTVQLKKTLFNTRLQQIINPCMIENEK